MERRYQVIDEYEPKISARHQCLLLGLPRCPLYYAQCRSEAAKARDRKAKQTILAWLERDPCLGYRHLTTHVSNELGQKANTKHVRRMMHELGVGGASFFL